MHIRTNECHRIGFGLFEVDLSTFELYKRGLSVHVQDQPFRILALLLERPGEVVTREDLRRKIWPADTFVDFNDGLNTAIKKLRCALGDSPDNPTFIETIPRHGYRFIAPLRTIRDVPHQQQRREGDEPDTHLRSSKRADLSEEPQDPKPATKSEPAVINCLATLPGPGFEANFGVITEAQQPVTISAAARPRRFRKRVLWALAASLFALVLGFADYLHRGPPPQRTMHFSVALPVAMRDLALSHDGRVMVFVAPQVKVEGTALWVYEVGVSGAHPLANTEGASYPFWSPDDGYIAFFADGKLKKIPAGGGPVQLICDAPIGRGGTWNRSGVIVFAADSGVAIRRVSAAGGPVTLAPGFEHRVATTMSNRWPVFLPDGNHFLYTSVDFGADLQGEGNAIYVAQLDSSQHRRLVTSNANAAYVSPGYLLFLRNGTLMAQRFDVDRLELTGEAFAVANEVEYLSSVARGLFSVSETGTLTYQRGSGATFSQLEWFDREGKLLGTLGAPARYANPRLSPDGQRVAVDIDDPESSNTDIWVVEANRKASSRFTFDPGQDETPLWSHDGRRLLWLSDRSRKNGFYLKSLDGGTVEESPTLFVGVDLSFASAPSDWSRDGRFLLYTDLQEGNALHLWVLPMSGDLKPDRLLSGFSADIEGQFSPDGHWVAYSSNESGRWQVYVAPFPGPVNKYQISTEGGQQPRWRGDGKELFFLSRDRKLMAVSLGTGSPFEFGEPTPLFETHAHEALTAEEFFTYDVSADGQRFLVNANVKEKDPRPLDIILNWVPGLK